MRTNLFVLAFLLAEIDERYERKAKIYDPAGFGDNVGKYLSTPDRVKEATNHLQLAYERAVKAESAESRGDQREAVEFWRKIFGDYFPAYG
jgi:hypothetical protein